MSWTFHSWSFIYLWKPFSPFGQYLYLEDVYSSFNASNVLSNCISLPRTVKKSLSQTQILTQLIYDFGPVIKTFRTSNSLTGRKKCGFT